MTRLTLQRLVDSNKFHYADVSNFLFDLGLHFVNIEIMRQRNVNREEQKIANKKMLKKQKCKVKCDGF
jgi:hypothetical protein